MWSRFFHPAPGPMPRGGSIGQLAAQSAVFEIHWEGYVFSFLAFSRLTINKTMGGGGPGAERGPHRQRPAHSRMSQHTKRPLRRSSLPLDRTRGGAGVTPERPLDF